eukprot:c12219_g2_i1.p1 GENE.c12219_g2_i1~~c12219_g2_i1.p1  ORF type:complete len:453 (+),score=52.36 c12219_g2_i1:73-1431(+)
MQTQEPERQFSEVPGRRATRSIVVSAEPVRNLVAFWLLGLINNSSYVIMNAGAADISSGATGLVYLANILPTVILQFSAPYWFDKVSYKIRLGMCGLLMGASFVTVAFAKNQLAVALIGVGFASLQCGMGEATMLGLGTQYTDSRALLTMWSSGTGMAGVFGYFWVVLFHTWLSLSFKLTLLMALVLAVGFVTSFFVVLLSPPMKGSSSYNNSNSNGNSSNNTGANSMLIENASTGPVDAPEYRGSRVYAKQSVADKASLLEPSVTQVSGKERFRLMLSLWPYTFPLFLVYVSEYMLQAGVWSAMGFPKVTEENHRKKFYQYSNWVYQVGVLVSRSSGTVWNPSLRVVWCMPILQTILLIFFSFDAVHHFWYNYSILILCFASGLLGGAVYVNAFKWIARSTPGHLREIAMSGATVASTLGISAADGLSVVLQACLNQRNGVSGAVIKTKIC